MLSKARTAYGLRPEAEEFPPGFRRQTVDANAA